MSDKKMSEREQFEAWYTGRRPISIDFTMTSCGGGYLLASIQQAWRGWLGRAALQSQNHIPDTTKMVELHAAAMAVVERWDTPQWKDAPHTGEFIERLRKAVSPSPSPNFAFSNPPFDRTTLKGAINYGDYPYDILDSEGSLLATVEPMAQPNEPAKADGWVSVDDRLPKIGSPVIAYRPLAYLSNDSAYSITFRMGYENESPQGIRHEFECWCHPTLWMPIPALPAATTKDKP